MPNIAFFYFCDIIEIGDTSMDFIKATKETDILDSNGRNISIACLSRIENHKHIGKFHFHRHSELLFCDEGEITIICGNDRIKMLSGDMIYLSPNEIHTIEYETNYTKHYCIKFEPKLLNSIDNNIDNEIGGNFIINQLKKFEYFNQKDLENCTYNIKDLFINAVNEYQNRDYSHYLLIQAFLTQIMAFIIRKRTNGNFFNTNSSFMQTIGNYIEKNYSTVTLKDAANFSNMSYNYFSALFHKTFGTSFKNYLNRIKINQSILLLKDKSHSITAIAYELGFSSSSHYIKTFKKFKEITPSEFRKRI